MKPTTATLSRSKFDAVIFDLDGVLTKTASVHAAAWKKLFDDFLNRRAKDSGEPPKPFDQNQDYLAYVDGKPRYDGVKSFLESRGISLPWGDPDDSPEKETVCGLGNRKNRFFQDHLRREGVAVFESTVSLIGQLRKRGFKTAIISSSKNCEAVLEAAGLKELFDARIDGVESARLGLRGKPEPDIFLETAKRLEVRPEKAVVVEDALSGVQAGRAGRFGLVIGVNRADQQKDLAENGADIVVDDLAEVGLSENGAPVSASLLRSAEDWLEEICETPADRMIVFLDYDGTLTPIVERPEDAVLSPETRDVLERLARHCRVAVVSGRDLADVREKVGVPNLIYAGSHGFDISGPGQLKQENPEANKLLRFLEEAEGELREKLEGIGGAQIERKKFTIAVHYRRVDPADRNRVMAVVDDVLSTRSELRRGEGKMVLEIQPRIDWHKGKAVAWLLQALEMDHPGVHPIYIGDDITDEDAFETLRERGTGTGIVVREGLDRESHAHCALETTDDVSRFLSRMAAALSVGTGLDRWALVYDDFNPGQEKLRESLCTLGNGYFATRGAAAESGAGEIHYPGTYLAGGYNRLKTGIADREVENEDLVNMPNWLVFNFRIESGPWFEMADAEILSFRQELDLKRGVLTRTIRFKDNKDRITRMRQRRIVHMKHPHLAAMETTLTAENWSGEMETLSAIDGRVINDGVERYRKLNQRHLVPLETDATPAKDLFLKVRTVASGLTIAMAARHRYYRNGEPLEPAGETRAEKGYVARHAKAVIRQGETLRVVKTAALHTSRDNAVSEPGLEARTAVRRAPDFDALLDSHVLAWRHLWEHFDFELELKSPAQSQRTAMILHLHIFHLLQTTSLHTIDLDVGVPSRGWHGEAYRGHVFWDELFIFPLLNLRFPAITRALLIYRHRRLGEARQAAAEAGYRGAMFPWQSGSNGREETQTLHLNPKSGRWIPDNSHRQRHVNAAIAHNIWHYFQATADTGFMMFYGAEMFLEIARFWGSIATPDADGERFEIKGVMGPDEYHEAYPGADEGGLSNNAYTNIMAAWVLKHAPDVLDLLPADRRREICEDLNLQAEELKLWDTISRKLKIVFHGEGIISQFEGYDRLKELNWKHYHERHGHVLRLDRILEAENDSANGYKASKQADVLMLFYLFSTEELMELFQHLGYRFEPAMIPRNIHYYLERTSHGSTLSQVVHSWVLARSDRAHSWKLFNEALESDIGDVQGGTTQEGIHLGAMAGTVDLLQRGYIGLETRGDILILNPSLPDEVTSLRIRTRYRGHSLQIELSGNQIQIQSLRTLDSPIAVQCREQVLQLEGDERIRFSLRDGS